MDKKLIAGTILFTFVVPIMFMKPFEETSLLEYLMQCFVPLTIALVFWANYLWIIPRYDFNPRFRQRFIAQNAILMMVSCAIVALVHVLEFHYFSDAGRPGRPPMRLDTRFFVLCGFRDLLNYSIAIVVAYSICLSSHADTLKRKQQETEMARRDAELRSLRNQISPHFLLNTLNNIYALSAISTERTQSAVMQLSKMLRHMLYDNQSELVTLASEASFISSYVDLMRLRLASNIHVSTHIDVSPDSPTKVSPLLFISLVENAFKHGVSPTEPCTIDIMLTEQPGTSITCAIKNSNHPKLSTDRSGHGVGMTLVQQRLDMLYPDHYTWTKGVEADGLYHSTIILNS